MIKSFPFHYGWVILAAGMLGSFMTLPGQAAGVSVFSDSFTQELGIARSGVRGHRDTNRTRDQFPRLETQYVAL